MSYFDHFADPGTTRIGNWIVKRIVQTEFHLMHPYLRDPEIAILEIGPGMGELGEKFLQSGYHDYTGIEPNLRMRERLTQRGFTVRDYQVPPLKEPDSEYDFIVLSNVFEHFNDTRDALSFMVDTHRVLRPGGRVCIFSPDYLHWKEEFFNSDYTHSNVTSVRRTIQLFHDSGFRVCHYGYLSGFFTGFMATLFSQLVKILLYFVDSNGLDKKYFKLKTTFLRRFIVIGEKK
jgi:SAM-dependent methyltransferase